MNPLIFQTIFSVALCGIVCADQAPQADREAQLAAMFTEHKQLIDEQCYEEALRIARKAHEIAPDEPAVQVMLTLTQQVFDVHSEPRIFLRNGVESQSPQPVAQAQLLMNLESERHFTATGNAHFDECRSTDDA